MGGLGFRVLFFLFCWGGGGGFGFRLQGFVVFWAVLGLGIRV